LITLSARDPSAWRLQIEQQLGNMLETKRMNFKSIVKLRERPEVKQLIKILQTDFATELEDDDALSRIQPA